MVVAVRSGVQEPRFRSVPGYVSSRGLEAVEIAESCGLVLDRWQVETLVDAMGVREDGKFAAFEVGVNVTRQNGKGSILEARELASIFLYGDRLVIHSAHEFATATVAMDRMEELLEEGGLTSELKPRGGVSRSHGSEGFRFKGNRRIWYRTRTKGGGRGFTGDLVILDEAMDLQEAFHGALLPIMSARSVTGNPQVWYTGSAVDQLVHEYGVMFALVRDRGLSGDDPSLAYFEWSAEVLNDRGEEVKLRDVKRDILSDIEYWEQANPALHTRIAASHVEKELRSMDVRMFAVERLGIGDYPETDGTGTVIPIQKWLDLADPSSTVVDPVAFAYDVAPDRSSASIAVAGFREDGLAHVEVVAERAGTRWLTDELVGLVGRHKTVGVFCDASGPAGSLIDGLEARRVQVEAVSATDYARACGMLFDMVDGEELRHLNTPEVREAIQGAAKRTLGDSWAWSRKNSAINISPLVAITLGLWGAVTTRRQTSTPMVAYG